jgi:hypothetical protein
MQPMPMGGIIMPKMTAKIFRPMKRITKRALPMKKAPAAKRSKSKPMRKPVKMVAKKIPSKKVPANNAAPTQPVVAAKPFEKKEIKRFSKEERKELEKKMPKAYKENKWNPDIEILTHNEALEGKSKTVGQECCVTCSNRNCV